MGPDRSGSAACFALGMLILAITLLWLDTAAHAEEGRTLAPPRLYVHTGVGAGYSHYWQIGGADRDVGGAIIELPITLAARLRPSLAIGGAVALQLFPAQAGTNHVSGKPIEDTFGVGGYIGVAIVFLTASVVQGEVVVGVGGAGVGGKWGGVGLVIAPSLMLDVWSVGWSHVAVEIRALYGQWAFPDTPAVRPFVGALAGISFSVH